MENNTNNNNQLLPKVSPLVAGFFGLISVFFLYQIGGGILSLLVFGSNIENANFNLVRLLTLGGQMMFILLPALILTKAVYEDVTTAIRFNIPTKKEILLYIIGFILLAVAIQNYLFIQTYFIDKLAETNPTIQQLKDLIDKLNKLVEGTYTKMLLSNSIFESIFIVIVIALTPAICEEIFFRGYIQRSFELKTTPFWGAFISAVFFGFYHFNPYGLIPLIALGLYFGFVTYNSNSILIAFILHFINNFIAVVSFLIFGQEELIDTTVVTDNNLLLNIISFIFIISVFSFFIYYMKKNSTLKTNKKDEDLPKSLNNNE